MHCHYNQTPWHLPKWYLQQNGGEQGKMPTHPKRMHCWNEETMALKTRAGHETGLHVKANLH
jgi:hypothetical protein